MRDGRAGLWITTGRSAWLAMLLAGLIVIPRSVAISRAHSESCDDRFHLVRGLAFLAGDLGILDLAPGLLVNDPPLGAGVVALPLWVDNLARGRPATEFDPLEHPLGPDFRFGLVAAWKALLFLPMVGVTFAWARSLYGTRSAWLASGILVAEPTFAAHIPIPALDVLGAEATLIAAFLAWRSFQQPTRGRQVACGVGIAAALLIKQNALVLPPVLLGYAGLCWGLRPILDRPGWGEVAARLPSQVLATARTLLVTAAALWALTLFDVSPKSMEDLWTAQHYPSASRAPGDPRPVELWPAGSYFRSVQQGMNHNRKGHPGFLLGERRWDGWRHYFLVASTVKIPLGAFALMALGIGSIAWNRPRWGEWGLVVPAIGCLGLALATHINIGFRHFLPTYAFLILLASRSLSRAPRRAILAAWVAMGAMAAHAAAFHPDYLSYGNGIWRRPYLVLSDSNVDWGQGLKEVRDWVDARPRDDRPIRMAYFGNVTAVRSYLGDRPVEILESEAEIPRDGLLIASPVVVAAPYHPLDKLGALRGIEPDEVIGHSLLVYDVGRLRLAGALP